ncbi:MAG: hypothetical protein WC980_07590 [Candidatus Brocadiia bacterium]
MKLLIKLLLVFCFLSLVSPVLGAEIESVKIGWDGNYRIGYWCPVKVSLITDKQYDGELVFRVDNVTYIHPLTIPVSSTRVIDFDVVINSQYPEMDIHLTGENKLSLTYQQPKFIPDGKVSIGVEESLWEQAWKSNHLVQPGLLFYPFKISELPENPFSYEAMDQLVFSRNIKEQQVWAKLQRLEEGGYINILFAEDELMYDSFTETGRDYYPMESVFPAAYQNFDISPWAIDIKKILLGFLEVYSLILMVIALLVIWIRIKKKSAMIFICSLVLCLVVVLILLYSVYLPSDGVLKLNVIGEETIKKYDTEYKLIMINNQFSPEGSVVKFSSPYYKPIYRGQADKTPLTIRFINGGSIKVEMPLGARMVFQTAQ